MRHRPVQASFRSFFQSQQNNLLFIRAVLAASLLGLLIFGASAPRASATGQLTLTPGSVDFGSVRVGKTKTVSVTMANSGNATVTVSGDTLTGTGYRISGITMPLNLKVGASLTFRLSFTPKTTGSSSGQLQLLSDASNSPLLMPLTGSGTSRYASAYGYISATPQTAQFGNVPIGTQNTQIVQLTNTGSGTLSISSVTASGSGFSASGIVTPLSLPAGATTQFTVAFLPTTAGSVTGSVGINSTASDGQLSISLSGVGITVTKLLGASPGSVAFGNVNVGSTTTMPIMLTNSGNSSLTISGATPSGAGIGDTGVGGGLTLAAGQSTTVTASFTPQVSGSVAGGITISSNATNAPSLTVPVSGAGVAPTRNVALQWQPSTSGGVSGYYVYRGTSASGPYTKLNNSATTVTNYADSGLNSGTTYYYVVTAVSSDGLESTYSNQVTAAIP